jgi:hypothetical protein
MNLATASQAEAIQKTLSKEFLKPAYFSKVCKTLAISEILSMAVPHFNIS